MRKNTIFKYMLLIAISAGIFSSVSLCYSIESAQNSAISSVQTQQNKGIIVKPLTVVNSPKTYLNKTVIMEAKFDKFSTLGLDYKSAFRSSDKYISFLIKRDDKSFNIPLSEMKLFMKREMAEKFIDLKTDDEVEITGVVFSDALGDTWIDVNNLLITKKAPDDKKS